MRGRQALAGHQAAASPTPPFRIGAANDPAEQQADAVADAVLSGAPRPAVVRRSAAASPAAAGPAAARNAAISLVIAGAGRPLGSSEAGMLGARLGADLSSVRLHDGPAADRAARAAGARAFAIGRHIVFASGEYAPHTRAGRRLLAHELAHTLQDGAATTVRRQEPAAAEPEDHTGEVLAEGLATVAEQAAEHEPLKQRVLQPLERRARAEFRRLTPAETGITVGFGALTYGMGLTAMLADPNGRRMLSDVNLIAPLSLIPGWPLTKFRYVLPDGAGPVGFRFTFDGTRLLDALRPEGSTAPIRSLSVEAGWTVDPRSGSWRLGTLRANIGIVPGLSLTGGLIEGTFLPGPRTELSPGGEPVTTVRSLPEPEGAAAARPNIGGMVMLDLTTFPLVPERIRVLLGGARAGSRRGGGR